MRARLKKLTVSAMFLALGLVLPFLTGQLKEIGSMLLPMHLPVFLCGLICGWKYGLTIGLILPLLRSVCFGMPMMYPTAVAMAAELATYGAVSGWMFSKAPWHCLRRLYRSLIAAMLAGRAVWGVMMSILLGFGENGFTFAAFISGAFVTAIPGIVLQLILIPAIMLLLRRTHLVPLNKGEKKRNG